MFEKNVFRYAVYLIIGFYSFLLRNNAMGIYNINYTKELLQGLANIGVNSDKIILGTLDNAFCYSHESNTSKWVNTSEVSPVYYCIDNNI